FMPIVQRLDIDLIWFGVLYLICMQLGLLLPPHGLLLMTMKGVAPKEVTMAHIFRAVVPYVAMSLVLLVIIILVPAIATWLPNVVGGRGQGGGQRGATAEPPLPRARGVPRARPGD